MKNIIIPTLFILCLNIVSAQSILGKWKTVDDQTGKEKSIVEIYEVNGRLYGKIIKLINPKRKNPLCNKCKGDNKGKPILGMLIIDGLTKSDEGYEGGTILNPTSGKVYKCRLKLESKNKLRVRGYLSLFYKTQYWIRVMD